VSVHVMLPMGIARSTVPQDRSGHLSIVSGDIQASLGQDQYSPAKTTMLYSDIFASIIPFDCGVVVSFPSKFREPKWHVMAVSADVGHRRL